MKSLLIIIVIIMFYFTGCEREQFNPDYKQVITELEKDNYYKVCINHKIIRRSGENQYYYMSDSLVNWIDFCVFNDEAKIYNKNEVYATLRNKSVPKIEEYILEMEREASLVLPFMKHNGIFAMGGKKDFVINKDIKLKVHLENGYNIYLVEQGFENVKKILLNSDEIYVDSIDNWLVTKNNYPR